MSEFIGEHLWMICFVFWGYAKERRGRGFSFRGDLFAIFARVCFASLTSQLYGRKESLYERAGGMG